MSSPHSVMIMEPHADGHHGPYLCWSIKVLTDLGIEVTVLTLPESMRHPLLGQIARDRTGLVNIIYVKHGGPPLRRHGGTVSLIRREFTYWRLFRNWYRGHAGPVNPDVVFLPYLDYCLYAIALLGSPFQGSSWVGVAMRPKFHFSDMGVIAPRVSFKPILKALFYRLLRENSLKEVLTVDEALFIYLKDTVRKYSKVEFLPSPFIVDSLLNIEDARNFLGVDENRKIILVYGSLTIRKGVRELLTAIEDPKFPKDVDVVLAGIISKELRPLIEAPWVHALKENRRVIVLDKFIDSYLERALFSVADIVWLGYKGHYGASGVLEQAARSGAPVIATKEGLIGWQVKRHNLGVMVNPANPREVVESVISILKSRERVEQYVVDSPRTNEQIPWRRPGDILSEAME